LKIAYLKTNQESSGYVHHGLGLLSAIAKDHGHESYWANPVIGQDIPVGVDAAAITACSDAYPAALAIAEIYKARSPKTKLFVGGPHATFAPEDFEESAFDYIVRGEGETIWSDFCKGIYPSTRLVSGVYYGSLDDLPFVDRDQDYLYSLVSEKPPLPLLSFPDPYRCVIAGRGCRYNCAFCNPGKRHTRRSVDNVIKEISGLFDFGSLFIHDDNLLEDEQWCRNFIQVWDGRPFLIQGRADLIVKRQELLTEMVKKGLGAMLVGIESGSDTVLKNMRKGTTREINESAAKICHQLGITMQANMIWGTPGETKTDVEASISLIKEHLQPCVLSFAVYTPYPGSDWGRMCTEKGWNIVKEDYEYTRYFGGRKLKEEAFGYTYDWLYSRLEEAKFNG
jgi:radical SAM superfamily enzyme YgiQ (UPF0313 family)